MLTQTCSTLLVLGDKRRRSSSSALVLSHCSGTSQRGVKCGLPSFPLLETSKISWSDVREPLTSKHGRDDDDDDVTVADNDPYLHILLLQRGGVDSNPT